MNSTERKEIEIYDRILKYPPFTVRRSEGPMRIEHQLENGGKVIAESLETVTTEDAEKLFVAIFFIQTNGSAKDWKYNNIEVTAGEVNIRDIIRLTNCKDENYIHKSLKRIAKLSISWNFPDGRQGVTHILHEVEYDPRTGNLTLLFNKHFFRLCLEKYLTLDVVLFCKLSPTAKNLYAYLCSNPAEKFHEETLFERAGIKTSEIRNKRISLRKTLNELVSHKYIFSYKISEGFIYLKRPRLTKSKIT